MKRLLSLLFFGLGLFWAFNPVFADPTIMTRIIGGGPLLFGVRPSGMGGATQAVQSPATLFRIPAPAISADLGYSTLRMKSAAGTEDAVIPLLGGGIVLPLTNQWGVGFKTLQISTNTFNQQDNVFAPKNSPEPFRASADDSMFLAVVSKGIGKKIGLGLALPLFGKANYNISGADGNSRKYEMIERFSPLIFFHWQLDPKIALGGQISYINVVQVYKGQDFTKAGIQDSQNNPLDSFQAGVVHYEYKAGLAVSPLKGFTLAADGEYHFTDAPLHPLLGPHGGGQGIGAEFDSWRWLVGAEQWFSFGLPVDIFALRAGVFDEESITAGITLRLKIGAYPLQLDYAYVRNHSKKEFDDFEPGLFGESSNSHGLTLTVLLGKIKK